MLLNRRSFLKKGIKTAALSTVVPAGLELNSNSFSNNKTNNKIIYRTLGRTGIKVPIISMGTGDTNNSNLVKAAIDKGVKLLATSAYYGNGKNERIIGEILKDYPREKLVIMTSAMPDGINHKEGLFTNETKKHVFINKIDKSIERLGVDYIDICILPFAAKRESVFFEPGLKAMEEIKLSGRAKFIGIATHNWETESLIAAADSKIYDVVMTAYNFKHKNIDAINDAIDYAANAGLGIIAMKTMAGAYWDKERTQPINTTAALKWVLQNPNIHTAVPGITTFDQLEQDIKLMTDIDLSNDELIDLKLASVDSNNGLYCLQCKECIGQCKESLDIPTLMRSYMYAFGYRNLISAKNTLKMANLDSKLPCNNCHDCTINCKMNFNIKSKIEEISKLRDIPEDFIV